MNTPLAKVIAELDELIITMELVKKHNKPIRMCEYTKDSVLFDDANFEIADCGTPCCVAGYHALRTKTESFSGDMEFVEAVDYWVTGLAPQAPEVTRSLLSLGTIIFGGDVIERSRIAKAVQFPNWQNYHHITDEAPIPDDTLTLIRDIKSWLLEVYND